MRFSFQLNQIVYRGNEKYDWLSSNPVVMADYASPAEKFVEIPGVVEIR